MKCCYETYSKTVSIEVHDSEISEAESSEISALWEFEPGRHPALDLEDVWLIGSHPIEAMPDFRRENAIQIYEEDELLVFSA